MHLQIFQLNCHISYGIIFALHLVLYSESIYHASSNYMKEIVSHSFMLFHRFQSINYQSQTSLFNLFEIKQYYTMVINHGIL